MTIKKKKYQVFILEDNLSQLQTMTSILEEENFEVHGFFEPKKGFDFLKNNNLDVAIFDLRMPGITELGLIEKLKLIADDIPVIINTAYGSYDTAKSALNVGAFAYLEKGGDPGNLVRMVNSAVQSKLEKHNEQLEKAVEERTKELANTNSKLKEEIAFHKQTEEFLKISEERFELAMQASRDGLFDWNLITNEIYYSPGWKRMLGYNYDELPNDFSVWEKLTHEDDVKKSWEMQKKLLNREIDRFETEFRMKHKDGHWVDILSRANAYSDKKGKAVRIVGTHVDITERKSAEKNIKAALQKAEENERKLTAFIEMLPETVFEVDKDFKVSFLNKNGMIKFGVNNEIIGKEIFTFFDHESNEKLWIKLHKILKGEEIINAAFTSKKRSGDTFPSIVYFTKVKDQNAIVGIRGIIIDISELKDAIKFKGEYELANKTAEIKQQLLTNISHEIRTPMNGIMGMLSFLEDTSLDEEQNQYIEVIKESSETLLAIINNVLDLSRIEQGLVKLNNESTDIYHLLNLSIAPFFPVAEKKGIELVYEMENGFPQYLLIDRARFKQIINNLVSNAVKYTKVGTIKISLKVIGIKDNVLNARFSVEDTGIGISRENQSSIFNAFSRTDDGYTKTIEGSGLGLAIIKKMAELFNGDIGMKSTLSVGSHFWFNFEAPISTKHVDESIDKKIVHSFNLNILVAEDKLVNQLVVKKMLENLGCSVQIANNGREAIELFSENSFDIVLMDIQMPIMDGITATKKLKEKYKTLPPIIGLSAHAMEGDSENFMNKGLDDYIAKPLKIDILVEKLYHWSKNHSNKKDA